MGVAVQQAESLSLEQIEGFLDGCESVTFEVGNRAEKYALVEAVLKRHHYAEQKRSVKGLLRRFLRKLTGLSGPVLIENLVPTENIEVIDRS